MSLFDQTKQPVDGDDTVIIDPFADPVSYLASLGVESELIEVRSHLPEAA